MVIDLVSRALLIDAGIIIRSLNSGMRASRAPTLAQVKSA